MVASSLGASEYAKTFWSWWSHELAALSAPICSRLSKTRARLTLDVSGQFWTFTYHKGRQSRQIGQIVFDGVKTPDQKAIAAIARKARPYRSRLKVLLPEKVVLRKKLDLPLIADADVRQALYFELDRQTPFKPEDVYFDYRILEKRPQAKKMNLELTVVPRTIADDILNQVTASGFKASGLDVAKAPAQEAGINLLRFTQEESTSGARSTNVLALLGCQLALLIGIIYIPLQQLSALDDSLAAQLAEASAKAKQTLSMRKELDSAVKADAFLDEKKRQDPTVMTWLNALTKAIPDNTWLSGIGEDGDQLKINGYSSAAAQLISALDTVPLFKEATFSSPIVQDPEAKAERFEITLRLTQVGEK